MSQPKKNGQHELPRRVRRRIERHAKALYQSILPRPQSRAVLFILGCQRSGTTMMQSIFARDWRAKVYGEVSELSSEDPNGLRLNPLPRVEETIRRTRAPLVVIKPLVESQRALELLEAFEGSRLLWMFRDVEDVVSSDLTKFGLDSGIRNLTPICRGDRDNWRSEGASQAVRELVRQHFSEEMNRYDAAALFWYARNALVFEQQLVGRPDVRLCQYEELVRRPVELMNGIYDFCATPFPGSHITQHVHGRSVGKSRHSALSSEISAICRDLQERLRAAYSRQTNELGGGSKRLP